MPDSAQMPGVGKHPGAGKGPPDRAKLRGKVSKKKAAKPKTVKAQIRDLSRLLQKVTKADSVLEHTCKKMDGWFIMHQSMQGGLPMKASRELTAKLEGLTKEHGKRMLAAKEKQMSQRYHKVRLQLSIYSMPSSVLPCP